MGGCEFCWPHLSNAPLCTAWCRSHSVSAPAPWGHTPGWCKAITASATQGLRDKGCGQRSKAGPPLPERREGSYLPPAAPWARRLEGRGLSVIPAPRRIPGPEPGPSESLSSCSHLSCFLCLKSSGDKHRVCRQASGSRSSLFSATSS